MAEDRPGPTEDRGPDRSSGGWTGCLSLRVICRERAWLIQRSPEHLQQLDTQLHVCVFDRRYSKLPELRRWFASARRQGGNQVSPQTVTGRKSGESTDGDREEIR